MTELIYRTLAFLVPILASISYIRSIISGSVTPERATRLMYILLLAVSLAQQLSLRSGSGAIWLNLSELIVCILVGVVSIKNGKGGLGPVDIICYLLLSLSLIVWSISGQALSGLMLICLADFFATLPTIVAIWNKPRDEVFWFWLAGAAGALFALLASGEISINQVFVIYLLVINTIVGGMVLIFQKFKKV